MENDKSKLKGDPLLNKSLAQFVITVSVITVLLLVIGYLIADVFGISDFGQIGDFFNGIAGPVLSLSAIILIYRTYYVQKEELKKTTEALELTLQNSREERLENLSLKLLSEFKNEVAKFEYFQFKGTKAIQEIIKSIVETFDNHEDFMAIHFSEKMPEDKGQNLNFKVFSQLNTRPEYEHLKRLVYMFVAIYKTILDTEANLKKSDYLRFAINSQLDKYEMFLIKLFINRLEDLENLREELKPFKIETSDAHLYLMYYIHWLNAWNNDEFKRNS